LIISAQFLKLLLNSLFHTSHQTRTKQQPQTPISVTQLRSR